MYKRGQGVRCNKIEAARLVLMAAEKGCEKAQYQVGIMLYEGSGVSRNLEEAAKWFRPLAEKGDTEAQKMLVKLHQEGGIPFTVDSDEEEESVLKNR